MKRTQALLPISLLVSQIPAVSAFWRIPCSVSQTARIDPILSYDQLVSGHVHKFSGGINVNSDSDYDSLRNSSCSTCQVQEDKSAYWTPLLYYQHADGTFVQVPNDGMTVYYLGRVDNGSGATTTPFPKGFRMISGDSRLRSYDANTLTYLNGRPIADRVNFRCITEANNLPETPGINQTDCVNGLRAQLHFPTCWNGIDLYLPGQAHVAYTSQIDNGVCPPTHPVAIPHLFFEVNYGVNNIDQSDGGRFVFANGDPTGYGFHGDFINGWDSDVLAAAVDQCLYPDLDGVVDNCPPLAASSTTNFPRICPEAPHVVNERINGTVLNPLTALPGCNPVTPGPALAPQLVCPINSTIPVSTTTSSSASLTASTSTTTTLGNSTTTTTTTLTTTTLTSSLTTATTTSVLSTTSSRPSILPPFTNSSSTVATTTSSAGTTTTSFTSSLDSTTTSTGSATTSTTSTSGSTVTSTSTSSSTTSTLDSTITSNSTVSSTSTSDFTTTPTSSSTTQSASTSGSTTTTTTSASSTTGTTITMITTTMMTMTTSTSSTPTITTPPSTTTSITTSTTPAPLSTATTWTWVVAGYTFTFTWGVNFAQPSEQTTPPSPVDGGETITTLRIKGRDFVHILGA